MNIEIRKLNSSPSDYDRYINLINQFRPTTFTIDQFNQLIKNNEHINIWVIELNNQLIATGTILYEPKFIHNMSKVAHIEDICVDNDFRSKGYGKILIGHLIEQAKYNGCYKVILDCDTKLEKFYKSCGLSTNGLQMSLKF